jgi:hypothetical protein
MVRLPNIEEDIFAARQFVGNPQVGYKVARCQRDVAIYGGIHEALESSSPPQDGKLNHCPGISGLWWAFYRSPSMG